MWWHNYDKTREKYSDLISQLSDKRNTFCGIGTRKAKIRLNKLAKNSLIAMLYRKALEIEDKNIQAKAFPNYRDKYYEEKSSLLNEFIKICLDNNIKVGYSEESTERKVRINEYDEYGYRIYEEDPEYEIIVHTMYIVYFDLPGCEQISWHSKSKPNCPLYDGVWDGKTNSVLPKLEKAILDAFPSIID